MPDKLLELKNDLVFQKIFGMQKNSGITAHFISLVLKKEINNVDLDVNKRMLRSRSDSKTGRLDIRAKFNNGEDCNIELQVLPYKYMPARMLEYWAGMYDNKIQSGQGYEVLKPSISILIANYELEELKDIDKYHTIWNLREKDFPENIISNNIELHVLEIPKIKDEEIPIDELSQWLRFIENPGNEEVAKFMYENEFLKQAKEELAHLSDDPDFELLVKSREGMLRDIHNFKQQCIEEADEIKKEAEEIRKEGEKLKKEARESMEKAQQEADEIKKEARKSIEESRKSIEETRAKGREEGRAEGRAEGERAKQIEMAKKMKNKNMPIEEIVEITELTRDEIEKL